jgi:hypothetical protein
LKKNKNKNKNKTKQAKTKRRCFEWNQTVFMDKIDTTRKIISTTSSARERERERDR